jgi:3D (Asp-Asp-Asp) domain-containing protein
MPISLISFTKIKKSRILIAILSLSLITGVFPVLEHNFQEANAKLVNPAFVLSGLSMVQENSLSSISSPQNPSPKEPDLKVTNRTKVIITAYSSTVWETDDTPFITAAGTPVRDGIVANNLLPFGTKVRIPELYGNKIFVVEDRMNKKKGDNHFDIWFPSHGEAKNFGVKTAYIEIIEL